MFYKSIHGYTILNFDKDKYNKIISNIIDSNCFISYIDRSKQEGFTNKKFERYIDLKQALYTSLYRSRNGVIYNYSLPEHIRESEVEELQKRYTIRDDYSTNTTIEKITEDFYLKQHRIYPLEEDIQDISINIDVQYEKLNDMCINPNFINNQQRRFMLIPFITKHNGQYLKPIVIATIYGVGIITIQVIIPIQYEKVIKVSEEPPRYLELDNVEFVSLKSHYSTNDYWERYSEDNVNIDIILSYYESLISKVVMPELKLNPKHRTVSWGFGDFTLQKNYEDHRKFFESNKKIYIQHLKNSDKEVTERLSTYEVDEVIGQSRIINNLEVSCLCNPTTSIISIGYKTSYKKAVVALEAEENELKKDGLYESAMEEIFLNQYLVAILQYIRFYELTFIKRFFLKILLDDIVSEEKSTVAKYNEIIKEMNNIQLNYDQDVLFFTEGSPKDLYSAILEKSGVNKLEEKLNIFIKNIKEDATNIKTFRIQKNETTILIISSILTILLGYSGIKLIVTDILLHLSFFNFIKGFPLEVTFLIWVFLVGGMVYLNIKRWRLNKN